jgi:hypothetical protein
MAIRPDLSEDLPPTTGDEPNSRDLSVANDCTVEHQQADVSVLESFVLQALE